ncbi:hypothetical protein ENH_00002000 [Eimeria necatrix]|uniref:Uncharacterized protein n=1 Tax=Eimeria necatrix TaxID=51315 RepID=U6MMF0_9EIME|nr:hypothetical protein ENH_00002000 [Eimeria necatrix]CDJ65191.1 hypothetical protein ENH_00002000 [Eimeria necatrix]
MRVLQRMLSSSCYTKLSLQYACLLLMPAGLQGNLRTSQLVHLTASAHIWLSYTNYRADAPAIFAGLCASVASVRACFLMQFKLTFSTRLVCI